MLQERGQELSRSTAFGTARLSDVLSHHEIGNPSALFPTMELVKSWSDLDVLSSLLPFSSIHSRHFWRTTFPIHFIYLKHDRFNKLLTQFKISRVFVSRYSKKKKTDLVWSGDWLRVASDKAGKFKLWQFWSQYHHYITCALEWTRVPMYFARGFELEKFDGYESVSLHFLLLWNWIT